MPLRRITIVGMYLRMYPVSTKNISDVRIINEAEMGGKIEGVWGCRSIEKAVALGFELAQLV